MSIFKRRATQGRELGLHEIADLFAKPTRVLVSVSGRMIDRYYLQFVEQGIPTVILGPRDGYPAPWYLPAKKTEE